MKNQNLDVELDLTLLNEGLRAKTITPRVWVDKMGREHKSVTLFVYQGKRQSERKTHNVTVRSNPASWKPAQTADGSTLYCGGAAPSKYQPDEQNYQSDNSVVELDF